jgi:hypothetical protein
MASLREFENSAGLALPVKSGSRAFVFYSAVKMTRGRPCRSHAANHGKHPSL